MTSQHSNLQEIELSVHPSSSSFDSSHQTLSNDNFQHQQQSHANDSSSSNGKLCSMPCFSSCSGLSSAYSKLTPMQKSLLITLIICILAFIAIVLIYLIVTSIGGPKICPTPECKYESQNILQNLNATIDPCDDFYAFTCDGFTNRYPIPQDKSRFNTFDIIRDEVDTLIYDLFTKHKPSSEIQEPNALLFIRKLYLGCINETRLESLSFDPLKRYFNYILNTPDEESVGHSALISALTLGDSFLISIGVLSNPFNTSQYAVSIDAPTFGIDGTDLIASDNDYKAKKVVEAYRKYIQAAFEMLSIEIPSEFTNVEKLASEIISFEIQLAKVATPPEVRRNHRETVKSMNLAQLESVSQFKWNELLNKVILRAGANIVNVSIDDQVIIHDLPYIQSLPSIFNEKSPKLIQFYIVWRLIQSVGFMTTSKFRKIESDFLKTQQGTQKSPPLKERCSDLLRNNVPPLIGRIFVDGEFSENDKLIANEIIKDVLKAFTEMVREKDWMDEETKNRSITKAEAMKINIGYPDWIKDNTDLERVFNFNLEGEISLTNGFENETSLDMVWRMKRSLARDMLNKLYNKVDSEYEWPMSPALVNAAYDPTQNTITFPAAILRGVYFNASRPKYSNYAGIGSIIGHEITHGFDDEGAQYDGNGNLVNWWTNETLIHFQNKSQCLIDQYGSQRDNTTELLLNGKSTLGENIADCGGLREAYRAYINRYGPNSEPILPGLTDYTPEQIFFIAYGTNWCGNIRPEKLRQVIQTDPHAPSKYRANLPLMNFDRFAKAFNCKPNSPMNPQQNKCVLW